MKRFLRSRLGQHIRRIVLATNFDELDPSTLHHELCPEFSRLCVPALAQTGTMPKSYGGLRVGARAWGKVLANFLAHGLKPFASLSAPIAVRNPASEQDNPMACFVLMAKA